MIRERDFGLEVSKGLIAKIILAVVGFAGSIIFARYLGPAMYGAFYVLVAVASILDNPISGFATACKKRISEHGQDPREVLGAGLIVGIVGAGITILVIFLVGPYINYSDVESAPFLVGILFFGIVLFKTVQPMVAGTGEFGTAVILDMFRSLVTIPLQLLLAVALGLGVAGMVYGLTVASLLTVPPALYIVGVRPTAPSVATLRSLWTYARFSIPNNAVGTTYSRVDILLLTAVLGSGAAGQYQVAMQLVLPGTFLSGVMGSGLFVNVSSRVSRGEDVDGHVTNNIIFASLIAIPLFFGALAMPESIVMTVFGEKYREAAPLLIGLGLFQIIRTQATQASSVLSGHDRPDLHLWIRTVTLVLNLILGVPLIFQLGALGVVIATVVAEGMKFALLTYFARQYTTYRTVPMPLRYQFLAGSIMFVTVDVLHQWLGVYSWVDLLALVAAGAVVYGAVLIGSSDTFMLTARRLLSDAIEQYR
jgi:O-antigen/teichoic acid export membrane protein